MTTNGSMTAKGTFEIKVTAEPPFDAADGVSLGRTLIDKRFAGPLEATSQVHMLAARTPLDGSAGYVAIERVTGTLDGRRGSFVLMHTGLADRGARTLSIVVVPDSGTGELANLAGRMDVQITGGQHHYELEYSFRAPPGA